MFVEVVTTITSKVDLETMEPEHKVEIETDDPLPEDLTASIAYGGCNATMTSIREQYPRIGKIAAGERDPKQDEADQHLKDAKAARREATKKKAKRKSKKGRK